MNSSALDTGAQQEQSCFFHACPGGHNSASSKRNGPGAGPRRLKAPPSSVRLAMALLFLSHLHPNSTCLPIKQKQVGRGKYIPVHLTLQCRLVEQVGVQMSKTPEEHAGAMSPPTCFPCGPVTVEPGEAHRQIALSLVTTNVLPRSTTPAMSGDRCSLELAPLPATHVLPCPVIQCVGPTSRILNTAFPFVADTNPLCVLKILSRAGFSISHGSSSVLHPPPPGWSLVSTAPLP